MLLKIRSVGRSALSTGVVIDVSDVCAALIFRDKLPSEDEVIKLFDRQPRI